MISTNSRRPYPTLSKQVGMSLIEVMVALFIMTTGILGAVSMQVTAKKGSFDAMQRSLASSLAQDIIEKMRGNDSATLALYAANSPYGDGVVAVPPACNSLAAICQPVQMVNHDLFGWEQALMGARATNSGNNVGGLIEGIGCIAVNGNTVTVAIAWQGKSTYTDANRAAGCGTASDTRRQVVVTAFIM